MARAAFHPRLRRPRPARCAVARRGALAGLALLPALVASGLLPRVASAEPEPELRATVACDRAAGPGRVRCTVEARAAERRTLAWADVQVLEVPDLASPLKARIGPSEATSRQATSAAWAFALVARRGGQGEARVRVRAVTCRDTGEDAGAAPPRCSPVSVEVRALVVVG